MLPMLLLNDIKIGDKVKVSQLENIYGKYIFLANSKLIDCGMDAEGEVVYISSTRDEKCDLIRKKYDNLYTFYKDIFEESDDITWEE